MSLHLTHRLCDILTILFSTFDGRLWINRNRFSSTIARQHTQNEENKGEHCLMSMLVIPVYSFLRFYTNFREYSTSMEAHEILFPKYQDYLLLSG